ncbi:MAG TPA: DUF4430 domain-containing protein [Solirubrobacteraceae bacterium]
MLRRRARTALLLAALSVVLGGCGLGAGSTQDDPVTVTVTRDFGSHVVQERTASKLPSSETVMRLLQRGANVSTRYGGGFVQCVDRLCGGSRVDWFYFVDGVEAGKGAAGTTVHGGDRVWWDLRDWRGAQRVPAVVGSFPEPFLHGPGTDKRLPVRIECAAVSSPACSAVEKVLVHYGIPAAKGTLNSSFTRDTLRVLVGPWKQVRVDPAAVALEDGPQASGVFAEPRPDGTAIALLDARGRAVRSLGAGGGLVAATRAGEDQPVWTVTGTDEAGVQAAAAAFSQAGLRNRFAVAAATGAAPLGLPLGAGAR